MNTYKFPFKTHIMLFIVGFIGILSVIPIVGQMVQISGQPLPIPLAAVQVISVLQSSVILLLMLTIGAVLAPRVNLKAPVLSHPHQLWQQLKPQILPALIGGFIGGLMITDISASLATDLPKAFLEAGKSLYLPWYSRLFYGGITEELLARWGLMSLFVWLSYKLLQRDDESPKRYHYVIGILLSALLFGAGHLPAAIHLAGGLTPELLSYILINNGLFGLIAGWLFWKYGLECAIVAHMMAHITMIVANAVLTS